MTDTKLVGIIAAVEDIKQFKRFIESSYKICVIMNIHISMLDTIFKIAQENEKLVLVHIDLIRGLANDEYGTEYICQKYKPYGVISIKTSVLSACRRLKTTAIQRIFLIDSAALAKSVESVKRNSPDYVEILPAKEELTGPEFAQRFIDKVNALRIEYKVNTPVLEISKEKIIIAISKDDGYLEIKAKSIIIATGCRERAVGAINIVGSRPAGVLSAGTAQRYINLEGYMVGKRIVILGSGDNRLILRFRKVFSSLYQHYSNMYYRCASRRRYRNALRQGRYNI